MTQTGNREAAMPSDDLRRKNAYLRDGIEQVLKSTRSYAP
jgi:hypothetical protein